MQIEIDVFSDVVCPWCFVGKRHLDAALATLVQEQPEIEPVVCWMPFFLNPQTPPTGEPYRAFLEEKFGGPTAVDELQARVAAAGRGAGIDFAFERIALRPNTLSAHRLIHRAQSDGRPRAAVQALVERIFAGHFLLGEDIGHPVQLAAIAAACGDDADAVLRFLCSTEQADEVITLATRIQSMGIGGVPFFVFNRRVAASGAQPPDLLLDSLRRSIDPAA